MAHGGRIHVGDQGQKNADNGVDLMLTSRERRTPSTLTAKMPHWARTTPGVVQGVTHQRKRIKRFTVASRRNRGSNGGRATANRTVPRARPSQQAVRFCKRARHTAVSAASARAHARVNGLEGRRSDKAGRTRCILCMRILNKSRVPRLVSAACGPSHVFQCARQKPSVLVVRAD